MNDGKRFEKAWKDSIPDYCFYHRLKDNAGSFSGGNLRFATDNICDCFLFNDDTRTFYALELKTTKGGSFTFWRKDFEEPDKKQTFMIKKNQILGLQGVGKHKIICGFVLNFRETTNHTYFISINDFIEMTNGCQKKSFNESDLLNYSHTLIGQKLLRTNYRYDIDRFLKEVKL